MSTYSPPLLSGATFRRQGPPAESEAAHRIAENVDLTLERLAFLSFRGIREDLHDLLVSEQVLRGNEDPAVDLAAADSAFALLRLLPRSLTPPELAVDADGEIEMDWFGAGGRAFSLSIRGDGRIAYAARLGHEKRTHGVDFISDEAVAAVASIIHKVVR